MKTEINHQAVYRIAHMKYDYILFLLLNRSMPEIMGILVK